MAELLKYIGSNIKPTKIKINLSSEWHIRQRCLFHNLLFYKVKVQCCPDSRYFPSTELEGRQGLRGQRPPILGMTPFHLSTFAVQRTESISNEGFKMTKHSVKHR